MPVVGVVADMRLSQPSERAIAVEWLTRSEVFTTGEFQGERLPLVLEVDDKGVVDERLAALAELDAVTSVEVIYVDFEDLVHASGVDCEGQ